MFTNNIITYEMIHFIMFVLLLISTIKFLQGLIIIGDAFLKTVYKLTFWTYVVSASFILFLTDYIDFIDISKYNSIRIGLLAVVNSIVVFYVINVYTYKYVNLKGRTVKYAILFILNWFLALYLIFMDRKFGLKYEGLISYYIFISVHAIIQCYFFYTLFRIASVSKMIYSIDFQKFRDVVNAVVHFLFIVGIIIALVATLSIIDGLTYSILTAFKFLFLNWVFSSILLFRILIHYFTNKKNRLIFNILFALSIGLTLISSFYLIFYTTFLSWNLLRTALILTMFNIILKIIFVYLYNSKNLKILGYDRSRLLLHYGRNIVYLIYILFLILWGFNFYMDLVFVVLLIYAWLDYEKYFTIRFKKFSEVVEY